MNMEVPPSPTQNTLNSLEKQEHETINSFFDKIHRATIEGHEWVETSPEIINHYNKSGLGHSEYFIYQNVKVCEYGKSEELQKGLSRQLGEILYGKEEGKVHQGEKTRVVAGTHARR